LSAWIKYPPFSDMVLNGICIEQVSIDVGSTGAYGNAGTNAP